MLDTILTYVGSLFVTYLYAGLIMFIFDEIVTKFNHIKVELNKKTETIMTLVLTVALYLLLML